MSGDVTGRGIPFTGGDPGDECKECRETIRPAESERMCHSCRVRTHAEFIDDIAGQLVDATDDHSTRMSILLALRRRMFRVGDEL